MPDLIILDLRDGDESGLEFVKSVKANPIWRMPRLIMFVPNLDIATRCYECGANACIAKPRELEELAHLIVEIDKFWFKIVTLPLSEAKILELTADEMAAQRNGTNGNRP